MRFADVSRVQNFFGGSSSMPLMMANAWRTFSSITPRRTSLRSTHSNCVSAYAWCAFNQSRSASFRRVCQPLPVPLKVCTMSASSLMFTCSFGFAEKGRPRFWCEEFLCHFLSKQRWQNLARRACLCKPLVRGLGGIIVIQFEDLLNSAAIFLRFQ